MTPSYLELYATGELARRAGAAAEMLRDCAVCPRGCRVDRIAGELGFCRVGRLAPVASWTLHFGEEAPLVGQGGSGTIFFAGCNLACAFCQNYDISHSVESAQEAKPEALAGVMLELQGRGAENINLVTPSHVVPQILEGLILAAQGGLTLPLVYNSGGYDCVETLRLLDGVVDIYMPDAKIFDPVQAARLCGAGDYPDRARTAIAEMHRQVGDLDIGPDNVARRGLLVRHLVMPGEIAGTGEWMSFLAGLSKDTYVNVMGQYRPCGEVADRPGLWPGLDREVSGPEMSRAWAAARGAGLHRFDDASSRLSRILAQVRKLR